MAGVSNHVGLQRDPSLRHAFNPQNMSSPKRSHSPPPEDDVKRVRALTATGSPFSAERYPDELCMVVGLLSHGHRDALKEAGRKFSTLSISDVAQSVQLLEEAHRVAPSLGLPWPPGTSVCKTAIRLGRLDVLARAVALGCPLEMDGMEEDNPGCWRLALERGRIPIVAWLRVHRPDGCAWVEAACGVASEHGHLPLLQWLRSRDRAGGPCPWDSLVCEEAACAGHLEILQWARGQQPPCEWNTATCSWAAEGGNLEVLQWLRAQEPPCPWDEWTPAGAAEKGHLEIIKWCRQVAHPPCPWYSPVTLFYVFLRDHSCDRSCDRSFDAGSTIASFFLLFSLGGRARRRPSSTTFTC